MTVTVDDTEWAELCDAAACAGMNVPDFLAQSARLVALKPSAARSARVSREHLPRGSSRDDSETAAWAESFSQRLHHRADLFRND